MNISSSTTPAPVVAVINNSVRPNEHKPAGAGWGRACRMQSWAWSLAAECADSLWGVTGDLARWVGRKAREADYRAQLELENAESSDGRPGHSLRRFVGTPTAGTPPQK